MTTVLQAIGKPGSKVTSPMSPSPTGKVGAVTRIYTDSLVTDSEGEEEAKQTKPRVKPSTDITQIYTQVTQPSRSVELQSPARRSLRSSSRRSPSGPSL